MLFYVLKKKKTLKCLFYVYVCAFMSLCVPCTGRNQPEGGTGCPHPRAGITGGYELPCACWESNLGPL